MASEVHGALIGLQAEDTGGAVVAILEGDPDGSTTIFYTGTGVARTVDAASGGLEVNNTRTGAGYEPVVTEKTQGTWTPSAYGGFSVDPTMQLDYRIIGDIVFLWHDGTGSVGGTSDDTNFQMTGAPTAIRPAGTATSTATLAVDNGTPVPATIEVSSGGVLTVNNLHGSGPWTNSGAKGLGQGFMVMYSLDP